MAVDMFLKLDGIKGESTDEKHKDWIQIESFSWGLSQSGGVGRGGGAGAGKVSFQDLHIVSPVNIASPLLALACASGQHIKLATLTARKSGGDGARGGDYLVITLEDLLVSSYEAASGEPPASGGAPPVVPFDQLSFNFSKISMEYKVQQPDGSLAPGSRFGWDVKANTKI